MSETLRPTRGLQVVSAISTYFDDEPYDPSAETVTSIAFYLRKYASGSESNIILTRTSAEGDGIVAHEDYVDLTLTSANTYDLVLGWPYAWAIVATEEEGTEKLIANGDLVLRKEASTGAEGDILYRKSDGDFDVLPIGTDGDELLVVDGLPEWVTPVAP